jgi:uncharacterized membrane protein YphA (DoxX/SURF4 family)
MLRIDNKIYYTLRFASAMCFIGHGSFGIITKQIWCNYFAVFGIGTHMAHTLMPVLGSIDILMGLSILFYPTRAVLSWLIVWGIITACLRPLSGEPFAELIERAGNFGAPLALLLLCGDRKLQTGKWFERLNPADQISAETLAKITTCLRVVVFLLLAGHGWLNLIEKKGIMSQYASLGFLNPAQVAQVVGIFEIVAALSVLIKPIGSILLVLLIWKIATELFYPHWELFEWVERGGSYGAILALWFTMRQTSTEKQNMGMQHGGA